jgi:hypothetical protein
MIKSHTGFQTLREVWLGDCYPASWYSTFPNRVEDLFCKITEMTKHDLDKFQHKLQSLGINVQRPKFDLEDKFRDYQGNLVKPPITPRDWAMTLNDTLYVIPQYENQVTGFDNIVNTYRSAGLDCKILDRSRPDPMCYLNFPSTVRVGRDLFIDYDFRSSGASFANQACQELAKSYRVHVTHTGDHSDGVFCPVAPQKIFTSHYCSDYSRTFPGWSTWTLNNSTVKRKHNGYNGRWWVPGVDLQIFNDSIVDYAEHWIGNSAETVFEVNMLVIDERNICCIVEDDDVCRQLENLGFTVHVIDFRCRGFWDGGLHCLTVDISRDGPCVDYWPGRGPNAIYKY